MIDSVTAFFMLSDNAIVRYAAVDFQPVPLCFIYNKCFQNISINQNGIAQKLIWNTNQFIDGQKTDVLPRKGW